MLKFYILGVALTIILVLIAQLDKEYMNTYIQKVKSVTIAMGFDEDNVAVNKLIHVADVLFTSLFSFVGMAFVVYDYLSIKNKNSK